jgi:hypothetical protein
VEQVFRIDGQEKRFCELTPADLDWLRTHPDPDFPVDDQHLEGVGAEMRRGGAATIDDLGTEAARRWRSLIGVIPKF